MSGNIHITKIYSICWIPSQRYEKNEGAGSVVIYALLEAQPVDFELACTDMFMIIQPFILTLWHEEWV